MIWMAHIFPELCLVIEADFRVPIDNILTSSYRREQDRKRNDILPDHVYSMVGGNNVLLSVIYLPRERPYGVLHT